MRKLRSGLLEISEIDMDLANINRDKYVDICDLVRLNKYINGTPIN